MSSEILLSLIKQKKAFREKNYLKVSFQTPVNPLKFSLYETASRIFQIVLCAVKKFGTL